MTALNEDCKTLELYNQHFLSSRGTELMMQTSSNMRPVQSSSTEGNIQISSVNTEDCFEDSSRDSVKTSML